MSLSSALTQQEILALPKGTTICPPGLDSKVWMDESYFLWEKAGFPAHPHRSIVPQIRYGKYVGAVDCHHGAVLLWDGKEWHISKNGIFLSDAIFVSDYYGFPGGMLFFPATRFSNLAKKIRAISVKPKVVGNWLDGMYAGVEASADFIENFKE